MYSDEKNCDLNINFNKLIKFDVPQECCLFELLVPNKLYLKDQINDLQMKLVFKWIDIEKRFTMDKILTDEESDHGQSDEITITEKFDLTCLDNLTSTLKYYFDKFNKSVETIIIERYPKALQEINTPNGIKKNVIENLDISLEDIDKYNIIFAGKFDVAYLDVDHPIKKQRSKRQWEDTDEATNSRHAKLFEKTWNELSKKDKQDNSQSQQQSPEQQQQQNLSEQNKIQEQQPQQPISSQQTQQPITEQISSQQQPQQPITEQISSQQQPQQPITEQISSPQQPQQPLTEENMDRFNLPPLTYPINYVMKTRAVFYLEFNEKLRNLLGVMDISEINNIVENILNNDKQLKSSSYHSSLNSIENEIIFLKIYCDIIIETYINDRKTNLLRLVPININPSKKSTLYTFEKGLYIPLRFNEIESIRLSIRDQENRELFFLDEKILATLILRPIRIF